MGIVAWLGRTVPLASGNTGNVSASGSDAVPVIRPSCSRSQSRQSQGRAYKACTRPIGPSQGGSGAVGPGGAAAAKVPAPSVVLCCDKPDWLGTAEAIPTWSLTPGSTVRRPLLPGSPSPEAQRPLPGPSRPDRILRFNLRSEYAQFGHKATLVVLISVASTMPAYAS